MRAALLRCLALLGVLALALPWTAACAATETRALPPFDRVLLEAPGELRVEQGAQEAITLEGDPALLRLVTTAVDGSRLRIGLAPGRVETQQPLRLRLVLRSLRELESRMPMPIETGPLRADTLALTLATGGPVRIARLDAQALQLRMAGAGDVAIAAGRLATQAVEIRGDGRYDAPALDCARASVSVQGQGRLRLAAAEALAVQVAGAAELRYRGQPAITRTVQGLATIERE